MKQKVQNVWMDWTLYPEICTYNERIAIRILSYIYV